MLFRSDGGVFDAIHVYLGSWYLENINVSYLVPLDFAFFRKLTGAVASRLYELTHHWFYAALRHRKSTIERRYSILCAYFPLKPVALNGNRKRPQRSLLWEARQQLRAAHRQLVAHGFLAAEPEWLPVPDRADDWTLVYTAGPRAIAEFQANQRRRGCHEPLTPPEALALPPPLSEVQRDLLAELVTRGITDSVATSLIERAEPEVILRQIEIFDTLVSQGDRRISRNPAGYLRTAIERNYTAPSGFLTRAERIRQATATVAAKRAEQDAEAEALRRQQERTAHLEGLWASLSRDKQQKLHDEALAQLHDFARRAYTRELAEDRQGAGHHTLQCVIFKLLEAGQ